MIVGVERWASNADHDPHLQGPHFQNMAGAMGDIIASPPQIAWHEIIEARSEKDL